jgi:Fic family protein
MKRGSSGQYETTSVGGETIRAFIPNPLPPEPALALSDQRQRLLERATVALGRLDSVTLLLPDPNIFLYAYVRREAVLSSQIEGTQSSLAQLERFIHDTSNPYPTLIKAALAHVQFETIHPFLDGNGRIGRLLIGFILHHDMLLSQPLLYLSLYFKQHRSEYYRLLDLVRIDGDWEAWLDFFLEGVERIASNAVATAKRLLSLFQQDEQKIQTLGRSASTTLRVFRVLCEHPLSTLNRICELTGLSFPAGSKGMQQLETLDIVREITGHQRNRVFSYHQYLSILNEGTEA